MQIAKYMALEFENDRPSSFFHCSLTGAPQAHSSLSLSTHLSYFLLFWSLTTPAV